MKKYSLLLAFILTTGYFANAQNNNANPNATGANWKSNGNSATSADFIGTTNAQDLIIKTNNIQRGLFDTQGKLIIRDINNGGGGVIVDGGGMEGGGNGGGIKINPGLLNRPIPTNPIAAYMLKVGGSGIFEGEVNARQLFVEEYITYMKSLKGPRIDVDTIKMDSTRGIYGQTRVFGDLIVKQKLTVDGDAIFNNNLTAKKGVMFDGENGLKYYPPTSTTPARYYLGSGTYQPLSTTCPMPDQNYVWFATQGAYISRIGAGTVPTAPLVDASLTMMTAPWDGNGLIEVAGKDQNGGTNNALMLNYFCGRNTLINVNNGLPNRGGKVFMGENVSMARYVGIGYSDIGNISQTTALNIFANENNQTALKLNVWNGSVKVIDLVNPGNNFSAFTLAQNGKVQIKGASTEALEIFNPSNNSLTFQVNGNGTTKINTDNANKAISITNQNGVNSVNIYGSGNIEIFPQNPSSQPNVIDIKDGSSPTPISHFRVKANGYVYAREVEIKTGTFPDYVFSNEYKLLSIFDVEKFIQKNKHLPGFEKGESYVENGIKTSEMFVKQQEKLEEEMLYIIELKKEIEELRKLVIELKNK